MASLIPMVQRLVSDASATTWSTTEHVQDALDAYATRFDYTPLWHDSDYRVYAARQREASMRTLVDAGTSQLTAVIYDVPDFGSFFKVGYLANDWVIRAEPINTSGAYSPNVVDVVGGTFLFSTVPGVELYLRATGYNVWNAAARLLMETPDTGREYDTGRVRGQVSRQIKQKWDVYQQHGLLLNRPRRQFARI